MKLTADQLKKMGVYSSDEAQDDAYARVMMLGPAKRGKTTSIAADAPSPLILNCDGAGACKWAAGHARKIGNTFQVIDVESKADWQQTSRDAVSIAEAGACKTIIVDSLTLLSSALLDELSMVYDGFELWREFMSLLIKPIRVLMTAPAHLFLIAHQLPGYDEREGIIPAIPGQAAQRLPAMVHDMVLFTHDQNRDPERMFALGPQKGWDYGCRNINQSCMIPATATDLFEALGITP